MTIDDDNDDVPPYGVLPNGITTDALQDAITRSGYPFQEVVAQKIDEALADDGELLLQEEWAYIDTSSSETRSIDVFAEFVPGTEEEDRDAGPVSPILNILAECKQSQLPYIFFLRANSPESACSFPMVTGLMQNHIDFYGTDPDPIGPFIITMSLRDCLHMWDFPFFAETCPFSVSMSKVARKGSSLELTGDEAYRSVTYPLMKAARHLSEVCQPPDRLSGFGCRIVICLAVLRAPMFGVLRDGDRQVVRPVPWVRAYRVQPPGHLGELEMETIGPVNYFDVVHETFLSQYLELLRDSFNGLAHRVRENEQVILNGSALWEEKDVEEATADDEETYKPLAPLPVDFDISGERMKMQIRHLASKRQFQL